MYCRSVCDKMSSCVVSYLKGVIRDESGNVDRYKQEKVNRKQIMRKQKLMNNMRKGVLVVVALALIGWLGYSAYDIYESGKERTVSEVNYDAVSDYLNGLNAEGSAE